MADKPETAPSPAPSPASAPNKQATPVSSGGSSLGMIFLVLIIALLLGGVFFVLKTPAGQKMVGLAPIGTPSKETPKPLPSTPGVYVTVPDLLINLRSEESKGHFLKLCLTLEFKNQKDANYVTQIMPKIVDSFQVYLSELRIEDLKGAEGIYGLKQHLLARVNAEIAPLEVTEVLFRDMLVQ